ARGGVRGSRGPPPARVDGGDDIGAAVRELVEPLKNGGWAPTVARHDGRVLDYAPYHLTQFPDAEIEWYPTMSQAMIAATERTSAGKAFERLKRPLLDALAARLEQ